MKGVYMGMYVQRFQVWPIPITTETAEGFGRDICSAAIFDAATKDALDLCSK